MAADLLLANDAGEQFPKLFYQTLDNNRQHLPGFYTDGSTVVWNGNLYKGTRAVVEFYSSLPNSNHMLLSVDCQPMRGQQSGEAKLLVSCAGQVTFGGKNLTPSDFTHQFILQHEGEIWKVASETFRCNIEQN
jgi:NTF2-related export protein 1/2